jgi:hypothetical protein
MVSQARRPQSEQSPPRKPQNLYLHDVGNNVISASVVPPGMATIGLGSTCGADCRKTRIKKNLLMLSALQYKQSMVMSPAGLGTKNDCAGKGQ